MIEVVPLQGLFSIYTAHIPGGRSVQAYLDPARSGRNMIHATYFDSSGSQLDVKDMLVDLGGPDAEPTHLPGDRLGPGHFIGYVTLPAGSVTVALAARAPDGERLVVDFSMDVAP